MKEITIQTVYDFFIKSNDFNGIPLRDVSLSLNVDYIETIDIIKDLVSENLISIQSSTNPHIIGFKHYPVEIQIKILDEAKNTTCSYYELDKIKIISENTEFPICLYPSMNYLLQNRNFSKFEGREYSKQLASALPQLEPLFFEIEVLDRYFNDPRFDFHFSDYSGRIACKYDEGGNSILREEDQVFLKTFGLGFDEYNNRVAVVYRRYLNSLTAEHQIYWKSRESKHKCQMLKEYYDNTIDGNWTTSYSVFSAFIGELNCLNGLSEHIFGESLFLQSFDKDNRPKEFTFFFIPTSKNYYEFILLLDKMLSDNINKSFFKDKVDLFDLIKIDGGLVERRQKGTIKLLEEWLSANFFLHNSKPISELLTPLKKIRKERQSPAHKISENLYDKKYIEMQENYVKEAYLVIKTLRIIFQKHPYAGTYEIPNWLEKGIIKMF
ncbi:hypothetical protein [Emticicia oligotrophica]|uniref:hypothetical protein n=1 Tax=Emticicia oligotrophica TaxID=312279 RepID=UPI00273CBDE5|nr:hypothetical protein [Emticicia oligotrophica]